MAFPPKNYQAKNPTGDKGFNAITKIVNGGPSVPSLQTKLATVGGTPNMDEGEPAAAPAKKPAGKGKPKMRYDTATHSFRKC